MLQKEKQPYRRQTTMTLINSNSGYFGTSRAGKHTRSIFRWFSYLLNESVAAFLAHRERQATLFLLSKFTDRELRDMGLHRGETGAALEDAAKYRAARQNHDL
jgi:uncharacterized protein YjiS (DUF1127 family)